MYIMQKGNHTGIMFYNSRFSQFHPKIAWTLTNVQSTWYLIVLMGRLSQAFWMARWGVFTDCERCAKYCRIYLRIKKNWPDWIMVKRVVSVKNEWSITALEPLCSEFFLMHRGTILWKECVIFTCLLKIPELLQIVIQTNSSLENVMISLPWPPR